MDKRELCRYALCNIQSILDEICTKMLRFEKHETIEDSLHKLIAIYNPLKHFSRQYLPGDQVSNAHKTTSFSMNYREYRQWEQKYQIEIYISYY